MAKPNRKMSDTSQYGGYNGAANGLFSRNKGAVNKNINYLNTQRNFI